MNVSASQCGGSGCESGWTLYLDQSSYSQTRCQSFGGDFNGDYGGKRASFVVEDEEDLSMVSDASSGPRHYWEDYNENGSFCSADAAPEPAKNTSSKNRKKIKEHGGNRQHSCLDDTASSPVISFTKATSLQKNLKKEASQGFSGTHFKGKSAFQKKIGFMKSGKDAGSKDAGGFQEINWE